MTRHQPRRASYTTATADDITSVGAANALTDVKTAIAPLASDRANIGSNEESLSYYSNQLTALNNNLSAANSQIMDVDVARRAPNTPSKTSWCRPAPRCWPRPTRCRNQSSSC